MVHFIEVARATQSSLLDLVIGNPSPSRSYRPFDRGFDRLKVYSVIDAGFPVTTVTLRKVLRESRKGRARLAT